MSGYSITLKVEDKLKKIMTIHIDDEKLLEKYKAKEKCYLQVFLDNCAYKIVNELMTNYLDENLFEDWTLNAILR